MNAPPAPREDSLAQGWSDALRARIFRLLAQEHGSAGETLSPHELWEEAERLINDSDLRHLDRAWREHGKRPWMPPGAFAESLQELRDEAARARIGEEHPAQVVRYLLLTGGGGAVVIALWGGLGALLDSATLRGFPLAVQATFVALALGIGVFFAWGLITPESRKNWREVLMPDMPRGRWSGLLTLSGLTLFILAFATLGFAGTSELLYLHGIATTAPALALDAPLWDSARFYIWNFLNAIPVLELPRTVGWELHFRFTDHANPVLLLLYKLAVIAPMIATGRLIWQSRR